MLTAREAFKVGFLARCAEEGLTPEQMLDRVKSANAMLEKQALDPITPLYDAAKTLTGGAADIGKALIGGVADLAGKGIGAAGEIGKGTIQGTLDAAKGLGQTAMNWGIPLAIAAPPVAGYVGGRVAAKMTDVDDGEINQIKDKELLDEYNRQTDRLHRIKAVRDYANARQRTGRTFV